MEILVQLLSGAVGGNLAGFLMKSKSLGTLLNSVVGILGGGIGGQLLGLLGMASAGTAGQVGASAAGGGVLMALIGLIRGKK